MRYLLNLCLTAVLVFGCMPAAAQSVWTPQTSGTSNALSGVVYGGGQFVAVADPGEIVTSPDGVTWTVQAAGTDLALRAITFGNGMFVATGAQGTILSSPDAVTWTPQVSDTNLLLAGAAFGNGTFVVVGATGVVRYSTDAVNWNVGVVPPVLALQGVTFGGGRFVAVGPSGVIVHSSDGQTWTQATSGTRSFDVYFSVAYANGTYVAVGQNGAILSSTDAANWIVQPLVAFTRLRGVTTNGTQFVAVGDPLPEDSLPGKLLTSTDGMTWGVLDLDVDAELNGICYGSRRYVVVGELTGSPANGLVLTSSDDDATGLTFEAWRQQEFEPAELDDQMISGALADPDGDGILNFTEYALGRNPKLSEVPRQILRVLEVGMSQEIRFERPLDRVGIVDYSIFFSEDLSSWTALEEDEEIVSELDGIQEVKVTDPAPAVEARFYRVVFSGG